MSRRPNTITSNSTSLQVTFTVFTLTLNLLNPRTETNPLEAWALPRLAHQKSHIRLLTVTAGIVPDSAQD